LTIARQFRNPGLWVMRRMEPATPSIDVLRVALNQGRRSMTSHPLQPIRSLSMAALLPFLRGSSERTALPSCPRGVGRSRCCCLSPTGDPHRRASVVRFARRVAGGDCPLVRALVLASRVLCLNKVTFRSADPPWPR
jgi:hypothetical protein